MLLGAAALVLTAVPASADDTAPTPPPVIDQTPGATTTPTPAPPPPPPPPADPVVTITCTRIDIVVQSPTDSGRSFLFAQGRAEKGVPAFLPPTGPLSGRFEWEQQVDPGQATTWIAQVRAADGTVLWSRSGTTAPCAPEPTFKYATPFHPVQPVAACGKTLADVRFPSTPGIVYSYDEWNAYARLQPGWTWDHDAFDPPNAWWITDTRTSDVAWLPRSAFFMDMQGCPRYAAVMPPQSTRNGSGTSAAGARAGTAAGAGSEKPGGAPPPGAVSGPVATSSASPVAGGTAPAPAPTPRATAAPRPSETPAVEARAPRVASTTGLGVAGGLTGACLLAVAGAFVVRPRRVPDPGGQPADDEHPGTL